MIEQAGSGVCSSKAEILRSLLEGTAASDLQSFGNEENDADKSINGISAGGISTHNPSCNCIPSIYVKFKCLIIAAKVSLGL